MDPLKFSVAIEDKTKAALEEIKAYLNKELGEGYTLRIDAKASESLNALIENLKSLKGSDFKIGDLGKLIEQLSSIKTAGGSGGKIIDPAPIEKAAEATGKFRASLSEVGAGEKAAEEGGSAFNKTLEKTNYELYQLNNLISRGESVSALSKKFSDVDTTKLDAAVQTAKTLREELNRLATTGRTTSKGLTFDEFKLSAEYRQGVAELKAFIGEQQTVETNQRRYNVMLKEADELWTRIINAYAKGKALNVDTSGISVASKEIAAFINRLERLNESDLNNAHVVSELAAEYMKLKTSLSSAAKEQERLNADTEKANKEAQKAAQKQQAEAAKQAAKAAKDAARESAKWAESQRVAEIEANKLRIRIDELSNTVKKYQGSVDTSELQRYIAALRNLYAILQSIAGGSRMHGTAGDFISSADFKNTNANADAAAASVRRLANEKREAASAASRLTTEEQNLAQALRQTGESARGQSQVLSDLKSMAMQYLGVWGGQQFLRNIIEIGGQLEMQRLSIGAILQNQSQANDLFAQIKGLAVKSPFGVVELDQMTKQLTAYGFKYNELYGMTKRLADISAATGTGVDRLALALGHVRSEAALSGYTLRQFSMGNVPMLQKLSEKLGKTTEEIRKMVRSKEISYEDVEGVIKDLTDEGGMFYNMQETISQSVKARFKNVKDAMDIMYGEMAEGGIGNILKDVADALMQLTRNWKDALTIIGSSAAVWGIQRAAMAIYTAALGKTNAATIATIRSQTKMNASAAWLASQYRVLTVAEEEQISASRAGSAWIQTKILLGKKLTATEQAYLAAQERVTAAGVKVALNEGKITAAQLSRLVATRKLSKATALQIIQDSKLADADKGAAATLVRGTEVLSRRQVALLGITSAAQKAGAALLSMAKSFAPMAVISGIFELWQHESQESEKADELAQSILEKSQEALKNTRAMMQETGISAKQGDTDYTKNFGMELEDKQHKTVLITPEFDSESAPDIIERWAQYIRENAGTPNQLLNNAMVDQKENARTLSEQFTRLADATKLVIQAQKDLITLAPIVNSAMEGTNGGLFDEDLGTDIEDYVKKAKDYDTMVTKQARDNIAKIKAGIDAARRSDKAFDAATQSMESYNKMLTELVKNHGKYKEAVDAFESETATWWERNTPTPRTSRYDGTIWGDLLGASDAEEKAKGEAIAEVDQFIKGIKSRLELQGETELSTSMKQALLIAFKNFLVSLGDIPEKQADVLIERFSQAFGIALDKEGEKVAVRLADWQKRAQKSFEVNQEIKVKTKTVTSMNEFAKAVQEDLKKKQEYINSEASHISHVLTINTGIKFNMAKMDVGQLDKIIIQLMHKAIDLGRAGKVEAGRALISLAEDELVPFRDVLKKLGEDKKWLKSEGYPETDPNKSKSKSKTPKSGSSKTYKDPEVEKWKARVDNIQAAYKEYEKWEKETNDIAAIERVKEEFQGILDEKDIENIAKYRETLLEIKALAKARYQSQEGKKYNNGKDAQALVREINKIIGGEIDMDVFKKASDKLKSETDKLIADLTRRWETYNSVRESTGDKRLALNVAGISGGERSARNVADAVRELLTDAMRDVGGDELVAKIPFDVNIDEESLRERFKTALGESEEGSKHINELVSAYKEWQKLQQNVAKESVSSFAKIIGSAKDYATQIQKINDALERQKANIQQAKDNGSSSPQQAIIANIANTVATADADWQKMKLSADYVNLYSNAVAMSRDEFNKAADAVGNMIDYLRVLGRISPEEYTQERGKLLKARSEWDTTGFLGERGAVGQFLAGGYDGLKNYYQTRMQAAREKESKATPGSKEARDARAEAEKFQGLYEAMEKLSDGAGKVVKSLQYLQAGINLVGDLFDSLGMEGASNTMSDAGGLLGGALQGASSLSAAGPWGMAAGAALGLASGLFQLHDKALEREIGKLREHVQKIESNTELIKRARERELGYDSGNIRRQMTQMYSSSNGQANESMYTYYSENSNGSGYQQEYANLIQQRKDYLEILDKQMDKKKKSNEEIEETKSKIAELDDQIMFFTQDLANELWSIDISGWADQLSDALASAFENGENMAKAYRETVTGIIQQMMQQMMQLSILEPMFEDLRKKLFGDGNTKGVFDPDNPKGSMSKVTKVIGDYFGQGGEGEKAITASMEFMTAFERGMQNAGLTVLNEASSTLSSGIQGTSEETSDLLAGYVNALRQDVSVNRILITQFVTQIWPSYLEQYASNVTSLASIDTNVRIIMEMMQLGSGAMYNQIASIRERIDNITQGIDKVSVQ